MKESYGEGPATHTGPESCADAGRRSMRVTISSGIGSLLSVMASHVRSSITFGADAPSHLSPRIYTGVRTDSGEDRDFVLSWKRSSSHPLPSPNEGAREE
jgi:hypothetical protein